MQKLLLVLFLLFNQICFSQSVQNKDQEKITKVVRDFLACLETQDTALYKSLLFENAQIWVVRKRRDSLRTFVRTFKEDYLNFDPKQIVHEVPLHIDLKVHNDIAIAWVPYELKVNGNFSHCGVDTFTLLNTPGGWKIVSLVYSVEPDGCADIKNRYAGQKP